MTKKAPRTTTDEKKRLVARIATTQKQTDAAKKAAKAAKAGFKHAKQKFKNARRAAKKLRKSVKVLKAELAALVVKKVRRKPTARKSEAPKPVQSPAPVESAPAPVETLPVITPITPAL